MPHIVIEYSANLDDRVDVRMLVSRVHKAALGSGLFETASVRTRAAAYGAYEIGNGAASNAFIHVTTRMLAGRTVEERTILGEALIRALLDSVKAVSDPLTATLSVEVREINPAASFREMKLVADTQPAQSP